MRVVVVEPPMPVVTWDEADMHLRLDGDEEQRPLVERLIAVATAAIDGPAGWLGRAIGLQILEAYLPGFGDSGIKLPYPPISSISSISYVGAAGSLVSLPFDAFEQRGERVHPAWPSAWPAAAWRGAAAEVVRIRYQAGYEAVPEPIRQAILLMVGDMYRFRTTASDMSVTPTAIPMSVTVNGLLQPYRVYAL